MARNKSLIENIFSLFSVDIINHICALLIFLYLVKVLGPEKYGLFAFGQAFIQYFITLSDYGFSISALRSASMRHENKNELSEIFSSVLLIKLFFAVVCFFILLIAIISVPILRHDFKFYLFYFGFVVGNVLFPFWFFQAMEKTKYIAILNLCVQFFVVLLVFLYIRNPQDYLSVPLILSAGSIITGILSLVIVRKYFSIRFLWPKYSMVKMQLYEGWHAFSAFGLINVYTNSTIFILGFFVPHIMVGYYSVAERIVRFVQRFYHPITFGVYAHITKLVTKNIDDALNFNKKSLYWFTGLSFIISALIFLFSQNIVELTLGPQYKMSVVILKILAFLPCITMISNIFIYQGLYAFGRGNLVPRILLPITVFQIVILFIFVNKFSIPGAAAANLVTEALILVFSFYMFEQYVISSLKGKS